MKSLSVAEFGQFSYVFEYMTIFSLLFDGAVSQFIIKDYTINGLLNFRKNQGFQIVVSFIIFFLCLLIGILFLDVNVFKYLLLLGVGFLLNSFCNQVVFYLLSKGKLNTLLYKDLFIAFLRLLLFVIVSKYALNKIIFFLGIQSIISVLILFYWFYIFKYIGLKKIISFSKPIFDKYYIFSLIFSNYRLMLINILAFVFMRFEVVLLQRKCGYDSVGSYVGATRFFLPLMMVSSSFYNAFYPVLISYQDLKQKKAFQELLLRILFAIGILVVVLYFLFSKQVFNWLFELKYNSSLPLLNLLIISIPLIYLIESLNAFFIISGTYTVIIINYALGILLIGSSVLVMTSDASIYFVYFRVIAAVIMYCILSSKIRKDMPIIFIISNLYALCAFVYIVFKMLS